MSGCWRWCCWVAMAGLSNAKRHAKRFRLSFQLPEQMDMVVLIGLTHKQGVHVPQSGLVQQHFKRRLGYGYVSGTARSLGQRIIPARRKEDSRIRIARFRRLDQTRRYANLPHNIEKVLDEEIEQPESFSYLSLKIKL